MNSMVNDGQECCSSCGAHYETEKHEDGCENAPTMNPERIMNNETENAAPIRLSAVKFDTYQRNGGQVCPFCGSGEVSSGDLEVDGADAWANVYCNANGCGRSWTDVYSLSSVEYVELNPEK